MAKPTGTEQWRPYVEKWAPEFGVPVDLAMRVLRQESGGRQYTKGGGILTSSAGALGLMQLMPGTARALGVDPRKPLENLRGGLKYLGQQYKQFGDWNHAVAAYNAGPGGMRKALRRGGPDNWRAYLPRETRNYENAIMGAKPYAGGESSAQMPQGFNPAMLNFGQQGMQNNTPSLIEQVLSSALPRNTQQQPAPVGQPFQDAASEPSLIEKILKGLMNPEQPLELF